MSVQLMNCVFKKRKSSDEFFHFCPLFFFYPTPSLPPYLTLSPSPSLPSSSPLFSRETITG